MRLLRFLTLALLVAFPALLQAQREKLPPEDLEIVERDWPDASKSFTGLRWLITKAGSGELIRDGDKVSVLYTGRLLNGKVFDKATEASAPFTFRVGRGEVIDGWEEMAQKLRLGDKAIVIVPFELGYGSRGQPPRIPRQATLVFEVEVIAVERK
ncbi:FKBP-type peptidyl-prolyl cis-trans isomerase [Nibricoccus sp. IMCC34717]|uniref:FKBP-type peptidyl-prolyl cis-trans isomerase n=1 Tax=Nibricoccus sp. IMCC34717 TaxID=3034021 RepID=UPI00384F862B